LTEEIEELEKKRTEIKFRDKDLQMVIHTHYSRYKIFGKTIRTIKQSKTIFYQLSKGWKCLKKFMKKATPSIRLLLISNKLTRIWKKMLKK